MKHKSGMLICILTILLTGFVQNAVGDSLKEDRTFINYNFSFSHFDRFFEDSDGKFWGCSFSGELALWDGEQFVCEAVAPGRVYNYYKLSDTEMLICTEYGLAKFNTKTFQIDKFEGMDKNCQGVFDLNEDKILLICADEAFIADRHELNFQSVEKWDKCSITSAIELDNNRVLLLSAYAGLWIFDKKNLAIKDLEIRGVDPNKEVEICMSVIRDSVLVGTDRNLYYGKITQGGELNTVKDLEGLTIKCLTKSSDNDIWIGTDKGLFVKNHEDGSISEYKRQKDSQQSLLNDCVWSVYEDQRNNIWVGVEGGISFYYRGKEYAFYDWTFGAYSQGNRVTCMLHDSHDRMWLGGASGLSMHDFKTGETILFDKMDKHSCVDNRIWSLYEDHEGRIWICTDESVAVYDEKNETFRERLVSDFETGKTSKWAYRILDTQDGYMWIASGSGGFMRVRKEILLSDEPMVIAESSFNKYNSHHPIGTDIALRMAQDKDGSVWGLTLNGIMQLSRPDNLGEMKVISRPGSELYIKGVYEYYADYKGRFWGQGSGNIIMFDPVSKDSVKFKLADLDIPGQLTGMTICNGNQVCVMTTVCVALIDCDSRNISKLLEQPESEFRSCYWDDKAKRLWLGGVDYCMAVDIDKLLNNQKNFTRKVQITKYELDGDQLTVHFSNERITEWTVPYTNYYFKLEGADTKWKPVNRGMSMTFNRLAPGEYKLVLARFTAGNNTPEIIQTSEIEIPDPWYRTWWFYVAIAIIIASIFLMFVRHYSLSLQLQIAEADKQQLLEQYKAIKASTIAATAATAAEKAAASASIASDEKAKALADAHQARIENANKRWIEELEKHVDSHLSDTEFNVARLAEIYGLNEKALYRRVKTLTGKTTIEYIKYLRMQRAASLLKQKDLSINEVMFMVGFTSASYFSKCFEEAYCMTPSEYRAKNCSTT